MIDVLFGIIGRIKLKNLIKIFPVDKTYDGDRWGCKDYFFKMDVLKEKGLDNAVGRDGVFDLMWDYENRDLREFTVFYMSCMSAMYKQQSGVGIAEKFCEDNGIGTYTMDRENGLLIDNQSGEIAKVSNKPFIYADCEVKCSILKIAITETLVNRVFQRSKLPMKSDFHIRW